jgi:fucose 4-O-acetylase-like acetyltransferase
MSVAELAPTITSERAATGERYEWLDVARGIGIILVAIGHALGGIIDSPRGDGATILRQLFFVIYTFHMPLFFILSGALVARRVERDRRAFGQTLLIDLVWPYFLWSVIQFGVIYMLGSLANRPIDALWPTFSALPYNPISQFWFLYALFLLHGLAILTLPALGRTSFLLLCLALKPIGLLVALPIVLRLAFNQAPWYGIGVFLAAQGIAELAVRRPVIVRAMLLPASAAMMIGLVLAASPNFMPAADMRTAVAPALAGLAWNPLVFPAGLLGAVAVIGIAGFALGPIGRILSYLGRRSMAIFILHIMGIAGTRIVLTKIFGVTDVAFILPIVVLAGLIAPVIAFEIVARFGWTRRLGLGRP